jgi:hypothetical protein
VWKRVVHLVFSVLAGFVYFVIWILHGCKHVKIHDTLTIPELIRSGDFENTSAIVSVPGAYAIEILGRRILALLRIRLVSISA